MRTPTIAIAACAAAALVAIACGSGSASSGAGQGGASPAHAAAAAPPKKLLTLSGNGIKKTATFTAPAEWTLAYSYNCAGFGGSGNFSVTEYTTDGAPTDVLVNEPGKGGKDSVPQHADAGARYLEVDSECKWSITVTG